MADQSSESVNVHECSWADLEITIIMPGGGQTFSITDLEGWKWSRKNDRKESRGTSGRPKKKTRGSPSFEGSATATRSGWMQLLEALEAAAVELGRVRGDEVIVGSIGFDVLLQHTPMGDSRIYTTKLKGCSFDGDSSDMKQGSDADVIELDLNPMSIATKSATGKWLVIA